MAATSTPKPEPELSARSTEEKGGTTTLAKVDLDIIGRRRPEIFSTIWKELGFLFSVLTSMLMAEYYISGFHVILPALANDLGIPPASETWPASVYSLVTGAFLLPFGRLADMYGGYVVFNGGLAWFTIWALVGGFSKTYQMLVVCRALQALGSAAFLPASLTLLGTMYRPGPRKNVVFSLYGAFAPLGFFVGILIGGVAGNLLTWSWYIWIGTIMAFVVLVSSLVTIPRQGRLENRNSTALEAQRRMDWYGIVTIVPGLLALVYALTDAANAPNGFASPQILVTFIGGIILLAAAVYIEGWVAADPLLPFDLFKAQYMKVMTVALFFSYGVFGVYLFYSTFYIEKVMGVSPLMTAVYFVPMVSGGIIFSSVGGFVLHRISGWLLLLISALGHIGCTMLFALMPEDAGYWPFVFPAMIFATIGIDLVYTVSNIFITTSIPYRHQGAAGALINSLVFLGIGFWLGIANLVVGSSAHGVDKSGLRLSYQRGFWLAVASAGVALVLFSFTRIKAAESELTAEEKEQSGNDGEGGERLEVETGAQQV